MWICCLKVLVAMGLLVLRVLVFRIKLIVFVDLMYLIDLGLLFCCDFGLVVYLNGLVCIDKLG